MLKCFRSVCRSCANSPENWFFRISSYLHAYVSIIHGRGKFPRDLQWGNRPYKLKRLHTPVSIMSSYAWIHLSKCQAQTRLVLERSQNLDNIKYIFNFFRLVVLIQNDNFWYLHSGSKTKFYVVEKFPISMEMMAPQRRCLLRYYYPKDLRLDC